MGVAWYLARCNLRRRGWRSAVLAVVAGLVGAVVLAGVAGARRTESAFDRMLADYREADVTVFPLAEDSEETEPIVDDIISVLADRPEVEVFGAVATALIAQEEEPGTWVGELAFAAADHRGFLDIQRSLVVEGRHMDPSAPNELEVNEAWAERHDAEVGTRVELGLVPPDQLDAAGNGVPIELEQPAETFEVVGIVRKPADIAPRRKGVEGTIDENNGATMYLTSAFWDEHRDEVASYGSGVIAQVGSPDGFDRVQQALSELPVQVTPEGGEGVADIPAIERAVDVEARALLGTSLLFGLVALALLVQAIRRDRGDEVEQLEALGVDRSTRAAAGACEHGLVAAVAVILAVIVALALSPLAPIGIARRAVRSIGLQADVTVLAVGAGIMLLSLIVAGAVIGGSRSTTTTRAAVAAHRPSRLGRWASAASSHPPTQIGLRFAVEPGRRERSVPVRSSLVTAVLGVGALVAAITFSSSLDRVVHEPTFRGWTWDYDVGNFSDPTTAAEGREALRRNPRVGEVSGWQTDFVLVDGQEVPLLILDDSEDMVGPQALDGRLPAGPDEIALARGTLEELGREVGDVVTAIGPSGEAFELRVVGATVGISTLEDDAQLDEGAIQTFTSVERMLPPDFEPYPTGYLVRLADDVDRQAAVDQLREDFPGTVFGPRSTPDIENLRRVQWLPRLAVAGVALLAFGSLTHALVTAVRVRRRELAVLKCIGFRSHQIVQITLVQAVTMAAIGVVLGIPLGMVVGRALWRLAADQIGTFAGPIVPVGALALGAFAALVLALGLAWAPGRSAARTPTAAVLRAE